MKSLTLILGCLIIAALFVLIAKQAMGSVNLSSMRSIRRACGLHTGILRINALTSGIHATGKLPHLRADAVLSARYLLVKRGSDADHFALGTAADEPLGVCLDEPSAIEDPAAIALLGAVQGTVIMVGSEALDPDTTVYAAANGKVQDEPAVAGTYWMVGKTVDACTADDGQVEVTPCKPVKLVVIANGASLATTQAAMATAALVKVLGA